MEVQAPEEIRVSLSATPSPEALPSISEHEQVGSPGVLPEPVTQYSDRPFPEGALDGDEEMYDGESASDVHRFIIC